MRFASPWPREAIGLPQTRAGTAALPVDGARMSPVRHRRLHRFASGEQDALQLGVGELRDRSPGVEPGREAGLALEDVADPGDPTLVEQRLAEADVRPSSHLLPDSDHKCELARRGGNEGRGRGRSSRRGCRARGRPTADRASLRSPASDPQSRPVELDCLPLLVAQNGPGRRRRLAPSSAAAVDVPGSR